MEEKLNAVLKPQSYFIEGNHQMKYLKLKDPQKLLKLYSPGTTFSTCKHVKTSNHWQGSMKGKNHFLLQEKRKQIKHLIHFKNKNSNTTDTKN